MNYFNLLITQSRFAVAVLAVQIGYCPLLASTAVANDNLPNVALTNNTTMLSGARPDEESGNIVPFLTPSDDISPTVKQRIEKRILANRSRLQKQARVLEPPTSSHVLFSWPLSIPRLQDPGYYAVSNFVDHDPAYPDHLLDFFGGSRTYDTTSGYNHSGTDISLWPFAWNKMDAKQVAIVAAADGIIIDKTDGNNDRSCSFNNPNLPNYVVLSHADGSSSRYLHMKKGSPTKKAIGATVKEGEIIGYVGSSGMSTGPHLHFEVQDSANTLIDPWLGDFNPSTTTSWWQAQKPYLDPAINKLTTGFDAPSIPPCANETANERRVFAPGDPIYFSSYYRDQEVNQLSDYTIFRPDNSIYSHWTSNSSTDSTSSYSYWRFNIPATEAQGKWMIREQFNSKAYDRTFELCAGKPDALKQTLPAAGALLASSKVTLQWDSRCGDTYTVQVREGSKTGAIVSSIKNTFEPSFTTKTLRSGKTYWWKVMAINKFGSVKSGSRSFTVQ